MDWEVLGALGEWAGAIAVVATLFYLAKQIRQSNALALAEAEREWFDAWNEIVRAFGSSPEAGSLIQRGLHDYRALSQPEKASFHTSLTGFFNQTDSGARLFERQLLSQDVYEKTMDLCVGITLTSGGSEWWKEMGPSFAMYDRLEDWKRRSDRRFIRFDEWDVWRIQP